MFKKSDIWDVVAYFAVTIIEAVFGFLCRSYDISPEKILCIVVKSFFLRA